MANLDTDYYAGKLWKEGKKLKSGIRLNKSMKVSKSKSSSYTSKNISEIVKSIEQVLRVFAQQVRNNLSNFYR
jgi:hypothetical protein